MSEEQSPYFSMATAYKEVADADGAKAKLLPGVKLVGKGLFNAGRFAAEEVLPQAVRHAMKGRIDHARERLKDESLLDEEREQLEAYRKEASEKLARYEAMRTKNQVKRKQ